MIPSLSSFIYCIAVECVKNMPGYFARTLYESMKGLGTDDETLLRVIISRCEVDMVQIKEAFQEKYDQSLGDFIKVGLYDHSFSCYLITVLVKLSDKILVFSRQLAWGTKATPYQWSAS